MLVTKKIGIQPSIISTSLFTFTNSFNAEVLSYCDYLLYSPSQNLVSVFSLSINIIQEHVVLVGEWYTRPAMHRFQSDLYRHLLEKNEKAALSMEQFIRPEQLTLDRYLNSEIG
ncbi:ChaN family lipoprotein [Vibrio superstes]|uniref:Haem-binding uptake Tiki superfamily ChaN domain-containing protein n=2 Tax=Vibrio superstes TaxID=198815 RepID=A0A511QSJ7_9VIBR|nr:ChaN family lipoprotein [Vibrio superstes]GEM80027.1 hypothetical protein VSU01S_22720 [Vibrio superstes NBRC 103154]